jgi:hypothetical protein
LVATAINFFKNCLLNACAIVWKNKPFLPNNCLTRTQTFQMLLEGYRLYNRMEKYTFFAEQLFDKNSNFPQAFWSILPVHCTIGWKNTKSVVFCLIFVQSRICSHSSLEVCQPFLHLPILSWCRCCNGSMNTL